MPTGINGVKAIGRVGSVTKVAVERGVKQRVSGTGGTGRRLRLYSPNGHQQSNYQCNPAGTDN